MNAQRVPMIIQADSPDAFYQVIRAVRPGYGRIGPIPTGRYTVSIQWFIDSQEKPVAKSERTFDLGDGLNVIHFE